MRSRRGCDDVFTSPLSPLSGWTWSNAVASDLPAPLRLAFPPSALGTPGPAAAPASDQLAVSGSGPGRPLHFPASGRWRHAQQTGSDVHWIWGQAADVLIHGSMRTRLPLGNPLIALRFEDPADATNDRGDPKGVAIGAAVQLSGGPISTAQLTVVACAPGAPGLDTLAVLRYLAASLEDEGLAEGPTTWQDFVAALSGLEQPLRILEPGGCPATGRSIRLVGGPGPVTLDHSHHGNALEALGITRAALAGRTLDVRDGDSVIASSAGTTFT